MPNRLTMSSLLLLSFVLLYYLITFYVYMFYYCLDDEIKKCDKQLCRVSFIT